MTCVENGCSNPIDYQCPYCESDFCLDHIICHSLCDVIEIKNTVQTERKAV